uniref:Uncharacterized protein n=1 Tax=Arundo donax TaxID=35708 RepID=A0A0A9D9I1_ARUDO
MSNLLLVSLHCGFQLSRYLPRIIFVENLLNILNSKATHVSILFLNRDSNYTHTHTYIHTHTLRDLEGTKHSQRCLGSLSFTNRHDDG